MDYGQALPTRLLGSERVRRIIFEFVAPLLRVQGQERESREEQQIRLRAARQKYKNHSASGSGYRASKNRSLSSIIGDEEDERRAVETRNQLIRRTLKICKVLKRDGGGFMTKCMNSYHQHIVHSVVESCGLEHEDRSVVESHGLWHEERWGQVYIYNKQKAKKSESDLQTPWTRPLFSPSAADRAT